MGIIITSSLSQFFIKSPHEQESSIQKKEIQETLCGSSRIDKQVKGWTMRIMWRSIQSLADAFRSQGKIVKEIQHKLFSWEVWICMEAGRRIKEVSIALCELPRRSNLQEQALASC